MKYNTNCISRLQRGIPLGAESYLEQRPEGHDDIIKTDQVAVVPPCGGDLPGRNFNANAVMVEAGGDVMFTIVGLTPGNRCALLVN